MFEFSKKIIDPVCHMKIDADKTKHTVDHNGEKYYFCSEKCKKQFTDNPSNYTVKGKVSYSDCHHNNQKQRC